MYCNAHDSLYLKANGEFPCWCLEGEDTTLFKLTDTNINTVDIIKDIVNGSVYQNIRKSFANNKIAFSVCNSCGRFYPSSSKSHLWKKIVKHNYQINQVRIFQVEPSYLCNLNCPLCVPRHRRKLSKEPPYNLPIEYFDKVVDDFYKNKINIGVIDFCGRGEPLMNNNIFKMVSYAKHKLQTFCQVETNGNFIFNEQIINSGLDEIRICLDGDSQDNYEIYRRKGDFVKMLKFTKDICEYKKKINSSSPKVVFKNIMLRFNDKSENILKTINICEETGVDELLIVLDNNTPFSSRRIKTPEDLESILFYEKLYSKRKNKFKIRCENNYSTHHSSILGNVDSPQDGNNINSDFEISGWSFDTDGEIKKIEIYINGILVKTTTTGLLREDVADYYRLENLIKNLKFCGFKSKIPLTFLENGENKIEVAAINTDNEKSIIGLKKINRVKN